MEEEEDGKYSSPNPLPPSNPDTVTQLSAEHKHKILAIAFKTIMVSLKSRSLFRVFFPQELIPIKRACYPGRKSLHLSSRFDDAMMKRIQEMFLKRYSDIKIVKKKKDLSYAKRSKYPYTKTQPPIRCANRDSLLNHASDTSLRREDKSTRDE